MISVGMLTWNMFQTRRDKLFRRAVASISRAGVDLEFTLVTNGSTDRTDHYVASLGGIVDNTRSEPWYGMELAIGHALEKAQDDDDIIVFSADDIEYKPGWGWQLENFWRNAPDSLKLASLFLEDEWNWNMIHCAAEYGGQRCLIRDSAPGSSWSFRAADADYILPVGHKSPGEDLFVCKRLREADYEIAQLDLAKHIGIEQSAWGNQSHLHGRKLDRKKWGFDAENH